MGSFIGFSEQLKDKIYFLVLDPYNRSEEEKLFPISTKSFVIYFLLTSMLQWLKTILIVYYILFI